MYTTPSCARSCTRSMAEPRLNPRVHSPDLLKEIADLIRGIRDSLGTDAGTELRKHGIQPQSGGRNSPVFAVMSLDPPVCVKLHRVDGRMRAEREWQGLTFVDRVAPGLAPSPLAFFPDETCPVMFMEFLGGEALYPDNGLDDQQLEALAVATQRLHAINRSTETFQHSAVATATFMLVERVRPLVSMLADKLPAEAQVLAVETARWLRSDEPDLLLNAPRNGFARGDTNLNNCLWDGERVRFVDLEYSGWQDPVLDLADLVEGIWGRTTSDAAWGCFIDRFRLSVKEQTRFLAARRLCALHWVYLVWRKSNFDATFSSELRHQIERTLTLLS